MRCPVSRSATLLIAAVVASALASSCTRGPESGGSGARAGWTPLASADYPDPPEGLPADLPAPQPVKDLVALAWNDLGMHCYQGDFSKLLILPPHNVYWTQVIARGEKPRVVTEGLEVQYETLHVTDPAPRTNFWKHAAAFGWTLEDGVGLKGKRTSGTMEPAEDHFVADGVPVVDFADDGTWDPFPMFVVRVGNATDEVVAQTVNVAPVSTEMPCDLCHVGDSLQASMDAILEAHDKHEETDLLAQAKAGKPVMCSSCHADPAMGVMENKDCKLSLSAAMHGFHADKLEEAEVELPKNRCQACHPGPKTNCQRDVMSLSKVTCTDCHGGMEEVADPARVPWVNLPSCMTCHTDAIGEPEMARIKKPNEHLTADSTSLYRHSKAHGGGGIYCAACHGSPHAVTPAGRERDNQQAIRLQGHKGPIDKCTLCHQEKPEGKFWHFAAAE